MRQPSMHDMPGDLAHAARNIAERLRGASHQAWLVGGAVRDLALQRAPKDVDLATDATPEQIEELFPSAKGVGRAFGTMLVASSHVVTQVTTFRSESGYSDARRPDQVVFGQTPGEDARRRDFTCNAMYLDPLTDRLFDPEGGLRDLRDGVLRCVGIAEDRFGEDGLRLLRLARFAADLGLRVEPSTLAGARARVASISGVSGERILAELSTLFERERSHVGADLLLEIGLLPLALPGLDVASLPERMAVLARVGDAPGAALGLAILFAPELRADARTEHAELAPLVRLRPSRELKRAIEDVRDGLRWLRSVGEHTTRAERIRSLRNPLWPSAWRLARALAEARGESTSLLDELAAFARALSAAELNPKPLLTGRDLAEAGIPPGPRWGALLFEAETMQLDLALTHRDAALAWLAAHA